MHWMTRQEMTVLHPRNWIRLENELVFKICIVVQIQVSFVTFRIDDGRISEHIE